MPASCIAVAGIRNSKIGQEVSRRTGQSAPMNGRARERMLRALEKIESSLDGPLGLGDVAAAANLSPYHFARLFRVTYGLSVMSYVRRRRLSRAADLLANEQHSILDVAIACGFGSHEAFTRTFQRQFGISPSSYRRNRRVLRLPRQRRLKMTDLDALDRPVPSFRYHRRLLAVGCPGEFRPGATGDIGRLWERFVPRIDEIPARAGTAAYGICCLPDEGLAIRTGSPMSPPLKCTGSGRSPRA